MMKVVSVFLFFCTIATASAQEHVKIGKFQSRAIFSSALDKSPGKKPAVILIPGSGANGPEEMMGPDLTLDHQYHSIFNDLALPLRKAGFHTLQLGKPGVEFFDPNHPVGNFYDLKLLKSLTWQSYLDNIAAAITYVRERPDVDGSRVFLLGHSEGTQVAVDFAKAHERDVSALILLGFMGEDMKTELNWQLYRRLIDKFVATDVDTDHDGSVSREEASRWPGVNFGFSNGGRDQISYAEIEQMLHSIPQNQTLFEYAKNSPSMAGVFARGPIYPEVLSLQIPVYVMTGSLDVQTRPEEALKLKELAANAGASNIQVQIIPGLGHGFSPPRPPRSQQVLDLTVGPVQSSFQEILYQAGLSMIGADCRAESRSPACAPKKTQKRKP